MPGSSRRNRLSCDRCHSQKLKCPKQAGASICVRCAKAGVKCVFSPTGTTPAPAVRDDSFLSWRPPHDALPVATAAGPASPPVSLDWSLLSAGLDLDLTLLRAGISTGNEGNVFASEPFAPAAFGAQVPPELEPFPAEDQHQTSICTKQLTTMLLDLDALWESLPQPTELHISNTDVPQLTSKLSQMYAQKGLAETIFGATQRLVDLYPMATQLSLALEPPAVPECEVEDCIHGHHLPSDLADVENYVLARGRGTCVNLSLFNLLTSCHLRLIDVLDRLLVPALSCIKVTLASPTRDEPDFWLPQFHVGSFTPKRGVQSFMQMVLLKHLFDTLTVKLDRLRHAVESKVQSNTGSESRLLTLQCELLRERHCTKADQMSTLGSQITDLAIFH